ncbi:hypothetical protein KGF54_001713 [Candida jiufengensis]|uniref:uncharacterized protein n=1 Tax=Candida jiufengensis TaxID=497108 RepID=UPI0022246EE1|nr:uncharacterized protein KGF54_001713 [Candida jiufengensis]KAI5955152.1 hypothetical protein KGF54_001713 [Candida jiufengensis]
MEESNEDVEETTFNVIDKKILSIDFQSYSLGVTCLDVENRKLYIYEDFQICNPNSYIEAIIDDLKPNVVFVSSRLPEAAITFIKNLESDYEMQMFIKIVADYTKFDIEHLAKSFDKYLSGINVKYFTETAITSPFFKLSVGTLNALYLGISDHVSELFIAEMVDTIEFCNFKNHLFIDVDSLYALQILPDPHEKLKAHSKSQKVSLFDLVNYTVTREGYFLLLDWVRKPLAKLDLILDRQEIVQIISSTHFEDNRKQIFKLLKQVKGSFTKIKRLKSNELSWNNWKALLTFLSNSVQIAKILKQFFLTNSVQIGESLKIVTLFINDVFEFQKLHNFLLDVIEPQSSAEEGRVKILNGVDGEIDRLRTINNNMEEILKNCTYALKQKSPEQEFNTIYIPQLGFLISKTFEEIEGDTPQEWQQVFATPTNSYYKAPEVEELDDQYGDVHTLINDREIEVIQILQEEVSKYEPITEQVIEALTELDCLLSLSQVSQLPDYNFPILTDGLDLAIEAGRHPLIETYQNLFIPNDINYKDEKITIITGANFSGKSVYITQVALIAVLAQLGCAIPAKSAYIGVVDKLLTRISSRESLEKQLSTFAIDINQLSKCTSLCTERSLIVIDEFGKGSDSIDSPALFGGALAYFSNMTNCPRCVMSTHFHELFNNDGISEKLATTKAKFVTTDIELKKEDNKIQDITYLYKVKPGITQESFGIYCAKVCGIPESIIERAEYFAEKLEEGKDLVNEMTLLTDEEELNYSSTRDKVMKFLDFDFAEDSDRTVNLSKFEELF